MMGAWQIGRSGHDPITTGDLLDGIKELDESIEKNTAYNTLIEADEHLECVVLVDGRVMRGQLILLRIPVVDFEPTERSDG